MLCTVLVLCCVIHTVLTLFCCAAPVLCYAHCSCAVLHTALVLRFRSGGYAGDRRRRGWGHAHSPRHVADRCAALPLCCPRERTGGDIHSLVCSLMNAQTSRPKMCTTAHICHHASSLFLCIQNIAAGHISAHVRISQDTSGYVCICHHTSAFVSIRQHTLYVRKRHPSLTQPAPVCASNY